MTGQTASLIDAMVSAAAPVRRLPSLPRRANRAQEQVCKVIV